MQVSGASGHIYIGGFDYAGYMFQLRKFFN